MAEIFEGPVDAGCAPEFGTGGAPGHDHHMVVAIDAQAADQFGDLLRGRDLARHAFDFGAPPGGVVGGNHSVGDIGQFAQIGVFNVGADVEDDEIVIIGMGCTFRSFGNRR